MENNRIAQALRAEKERGEKAFIPYIMAGDGGLERLKEDLLFFQKNGATAIELGIPFSDPVADGPVIQLAGIRALEEGVTLNNILLELERISSEVTIPVILMGYTNSILAYGIERFAENAVKAGVAGCIIPDLPPEEEVIFSPIKSAGITLIRLITLTSSEERVKAITKEAEGFIYAVTVKGITGARKSFGKEVGEYLKTARELSPVPVLAGFGISTPEHVRETTAYCDGVIVGSKIIQCLQEGRKQEIIDLIQSAKIAVTK
ncbi:tryptophan synthase subunit alpha [Bacillus massiliglaciei]|uniref:tryptophan synthase subunit alpha n=1 Tax=Bacillus massiliglaciei TaxID=1816693 RepID=UPI000AA1B633|nr:tryptophan synthase subunit alpha [Bacillus massiliglaciei]